MNPRPPEHDPKHKAPRPTVPADATSTYRGSAAEGAPAPPDSRLGRFQLRGVLGKGGMGAVYRAHDPQLGREVALKVLLPDLTADPKAKVRFLREARAQAQVSHDHIIPIHDVGEADGVAYLVMPLLKGQTLAATLNQDARPPLSEVVRIGREMAEGLAAAHEAGLIHRDIKPANIWLEGAKRRVKILDFGLARTAKEADPEPAARPVPALEATLTVAGAVMGTPAYMSPEQARGKPVDHRSDIFSLGVVLYQMATGEKPFHGVIRPALLAAIATEEPLPVSALAPDVPPALSDLIARMMAKSPADRPPTCDEVAAALDEVARELAPRPVVVRPLSDVPSSANVWQELDSTEAGSSEPPRRRARERAEPDEAERPGRPRWLLPAAGVAAAVLLAGLAALALQPARPKTPPPDEAKAPEKSKGGTGTGAGGGTVRVPPTTEAPRKGLRLTQNSKVTFENFSVSLSDTPLTLEAFVTSDPRQGPDNNSRAAVTFLNLISVAWFRNEWYTNVFAKQQTKWETVAATAPAEPGRRTHLAGVLEPSPAIKGEYRCRLFVDGQLRATATFQPTPNLFTTQYLFQLGHEWTGVLEEVRVSRVARYTRDFAPAERHETDKDTLALYHLDQTEGTRVTDASGNGRHGTIVGDATWVTARDRAPEAADAPRKGLRFRTPDKEQGLPQVRVPDFELTMRDAPFTLEGFATAEAARPDDLAYRSCFGFWNLAGAGWTDKIEPRWFGTVYHRQLPKPWVTADVVRPAQVVGRRTHLALVVRPDEAQLFVNGRPAGVTPLTPDAPLFAPPPRADLRRLFVMGQSFNGVLEEVRVSKGARYAGDFTPAERHEPDKDTLALYHLDQTDGKQVLDASGNNRHGAIVGDATWVIPPKP